MTEPLDYDHLLDTWDEVQTSSLTRGELIGVIATAKARLGTEHSEIKPIHTKEANK